MVKVGEVTGSSTPSARQAPRTRVVLPAPRSPQTTTTAPGSSPAAIRAPNASVSPAERVIIRRRLLCFRSLALMFTGSLAHSLPCPGAALAEHVQLVGGR